MSRLDKWKKQNRLLTLLIGDNQDVIEFISKVHQGTDDQDKPVMSSPEIIKASKEIIFDIEDGKPVFHHIMYALNSDTCEIDLTHIFSSYCDVKDSDEEVEGSIMRTLAVAAIEEVPVYPNVEALYSELARYHRKMLIDGFPVDIDGERKFLSLKKSPGKKIDDPRYIEELDPTRHYSPIEVSLMKEAIIQELKRLENADRLLCSLKSAIDGLSTILAKKYRNENELQKHLTSNPVLFGLDYTQVVPKHRLGAEFEMDYALKKHSGFYDLVEIEASSLALYNKAGNPSQHLVHAEQQVLDWLDWVEKHYSYANERLPGIICPRGFVIIGLRSSFRKSDADKLNRRNAIYGGRLDILTYDDLLERAKSILDQLESFKA